MSSRPSSSNAIPVNEPATRRRKSHGRFRSFRVRYFDVNVSTSVGHVCLFGDKRLETGEAFRDGTSVVSFAMLYGLVMHVAYNLRHVGVRLGDTAYLDAAENLRGLVGLLGALRAGCTVMVPNAMLPASERDDILKQDRCRVVLTDRPHTVSVEDEREVVDLLRVEPLNLPKELDWLMPRPLPDQVAIMFLEPRADEAEDGTTRRQVRNCDLASYLRNEEPCLSAPGMGRMPYHDDLIRLARAKSLPTHPASRGDPPQP